MPCRIEGPCCLYVQGEVGVNKVLQYYTASQPRRPLLESVVPHSSLLIYEMLSVRLMPCGHCSSVMGRMVRRRQTEDGQPAAPCQAHNNTQKKLRYNSNKARTSVSCVRFVSNTNYMIPTAVNMHILSPCLSFISSIHSFIHSFTYLPTSLSACQPIYPSLNTLYVHF